MSKIRELITPDIRISLFQTAMNNAGRNFEGKKASVKIMADYASQLYQIAIKEIENIGELSIKQLSRTFAKEPIVKKTKREDVNKLIRKIKKGKGNHVHNKIIQRRDRARV